MEATNENNEKSGKNEFNETESYEYYTNRLGTNHVCSLMQIPPTTFETSSIKWEEVETYRNNVRAEENDELRALRDEAEEQLKKRMASNKWRYECLNLALKANGVKGPRVDSILCRKYIFNGQGYLRDIVYTMYRCQIAFDKMNASEKLAENLNDDSDPIQIRDNMDNIMVSLYNEYIKSHPEERFSYKSPEKFPEYPFPHDNNGIPNRMDYGNTYVRGRGRGGRGRGGYGHVRAPYASRFAPQQETNTRASTNEEFAEVIQQALQPILQQYVPVPREYAPRGGRGGRGGSFRGRGGYVPRQNVDYGAMRGSGRGGYVPRQTQSSIIQPDNVEMEQNEVQTSFYRGRGRGQGFSRGRGFGRGRGRGQERVQAPRSRETTDNIENNEYLYASRV